MEKPDDAVPEPTTKTRPKSNVFSINDLPKKFAERYTVHIRDFLGDDIEHVDFLVDGCVPRNSIVLLVGEPGAGKSWVAYELARAVGGGTTWLGRAPALVQKETVLLLNYDNPTMTLRTRMQQLGFTGDMEVYIHTQSPSSNKLSEMLTLPNEVDKLRYVIQHVQPSLIVFDSLRQGHHFDENSNDDMAQLMRLFKAWTAVNRCTVVILHHTSKSNGADTSWSTKSRGAGELVASSDVVIELTADKKMRWTKCRAWDIGPVNECTVEIVDDIVQTETDDSAIQTQVRATTPLPGERERAVLDNILAVLTTAGTGLTLRALYQHLRMNKKVLHTILHHAVARELLVSSTLNGVRVYSKP